MEKDQQGESLCTGLKGLWRIKSSYASPTQYNSSKILASISLDMSEPSGNPNGNEQHGVNLQCSDSWSDAPDPPQTTFVPSFVSE
jgi:hypothetical protein